MQTISKNQSIQHGLFKEKVNQSQKSQSTTNTEKKTATIHKIIFAFVIFSTKYEIEYRQEVRRKQQQEKQIETIQF